MKKPPTVITLSSDESEEEDSPLTGYDDTTGFVGRSLFSTDPILKHSFEGRL